MLKVSSFVCFAGLFVEHRFGIICPYCVEQGTHRIMQVRADGEWFLCPGCGHVMMTNHPPYQCECHNRMKHAPLPKLKS
jgi:predicted RNA-binding Zn-ribbon protein involved in translation (DUF1610 family)